MILEIISLVAGVIGLFFGITALRVYSRRSRVSKKPTYSKKVDSAMYESGIYIEHGMVNKDNENTVRPEYKISNSFFEALH